MADQEEILSIFEGGELDPSLWPNSFKYANFEYTVSGAQDKLNCRRLVLSDLQMAYGFHLMGHEPPIDFLIGLEKCLNALTTIVKEEYKERNDA